MDLQQFLTIKDLMNFQYCPRIVYFERVLKIPQATTIKELKGRELHSLFNKKSKRNKIIKEFPKLPKKYGVYLESNELNLRTVLDCMIINQDKKEAFPIEYKYSKKPRKLYNSQKIQVFAECLLINRLFGYSTPFAFIKFEQSNELVKIKISNSDIAKVKETIKGINEIIVTEIMPKPTTFSKRCKDCCYVKLCRRI
ncbi:MAG: CRISPR-associated protein Cas4 [Candidatus Diapherotrites archaeon]|nr:CRISPR-associated protein Cas4 [Candidatus Diapherotrites archaeon]